jgi:hypothetical protein
MSVVLLDDVIYTDYGQFDIVYSDGGGFDGDADPYFAGQANGWVGAASPDGIYLVLGRRSGGSHLRIVLLDHQPATDSTWEDVVEVSTIVPAAGPVGWMSWAGESGGPVDLPPGEYRLRVNAKGRDAGAADELADQLLDEYLLEFWRASPGPDTVIKTTSADASYWNETWGGRK